MPGITCILVCHLPYILAAKHHTHAVTLELQEGSSHPTNISADRRVLAPIVLLPKDKQLPSLCVVRAGRRYIAAMLPLPKSL